MQTMLSRSPEDFYFSKHPNYSDEIFKYFISGLGNKKDRFRTLEMLREFISGLRQDYIKKDMTRFSEFIKNGTSGIFQKKIQYTPEECVIVERFLVEYGRKHMHQAVKIIEETLDGQYTTEQKAVALQALAKIANENPEEIGNYYYLIGPLCTGILTDEKKRNDIMLLRSVLLCFPRVKNSNEEEMKKVRIFYIKFIME